MTPRSSTFLALVGVLLAGIPLPALTAARRPAAAEAPAAETPQQLRPIYATLHCSGTPRELRLLHEGSECLRLSADELRDGWSQDLSLPAAKLIALEIQATWPEGSPRQAVTLELEPEGLPTRSETHWTEPGSNTLHNLFLFAW